MKHIVVSTAASVVLLASCATHQPYWAPYPISVSYGVCCVRYGERIHPGVDFDISRGTPVVAVSDGVVLYVGWMPVYHGFYVQLDHEPQFQSLYSHLIEVHVKPGESLKRGQLLGLSGWDDTGRQYLHFAICRSSGGCALFSDSYDPGKHWLGGKPRCFDPQIDYSRYSRRDITHPVACSDHARELVAQAKQKVAEFRPPAASPSIQPGAALPPTQPIIDLRSVTGPWEGTRNVAGTVGVIKMTISEDGKYQTLIPQGTFTGTLRITGGKLEYSSDQTGRTGTISLHENEGRRILKGVSHDGVSSFDLSPAQ